MVSPPLAGECHLGKATASCHTASGYTEGLPGCGAESAVGAAGAPRRRRRGWLVAPGRGWGRPAQSLDGASRHTAADSRALAAEPEVELIWLPPAQLERQPDGPAVDAGQGQGLRQ